MAKYHTEFDGYVTDYEACHCSHFTLRKSSSKVVEEFCSVLKEKSELFRETCTHKQIQYGKLDKQHLDVYYPQTKNSECKIVVFFHGGYWEEGSAAEYAFVAKPVVESGRICVLVSRILVHEVRIGGIIEQDTKAMNCIASTFPNAKEITLSGHSSGGHECITMLHINWKELGYEKVEKYFRKKLSRVVVMCGVLEVTCLLGTYVDRHLDMSWQEAMELSPIAHIERLKACIKDYEKCQLYFISAEHDSPFILKWNKIYFKELRRNGIPFSNTEIKLMDHFNFLQTIDESDSPLIKVILGEEKDARQS